MKFILSELFILFRESLEAALIIGLILAVLSKTGNRRFSKLVYYAVFFGILASIVFAFGVERTLGEFEGPAEEIFEGAVMIFASVLIISTVIWLGKHHEASVKKSITHKLKNNDKLGIFFLAFVSVFREGVESVLFLWALGSNLAVLSIISGLIGITAAVILGYLLFTASLKIDIKHFFAATNVFLIGLALFLFISGIHELLEAGIFGIVL